PLPIDWSAATCHSHNKHVYSVSSPADPRNITAEPGQNVSLPCRAPDSNLIIAIEWSRSELGSKYVFLFRNDQIDLENQHLSFKNRVHLQESQLKVGDMSLFLRNVTTEDKGTYECRFIQTEANKRKETRLYINLDVVSTPGEFCL
uniref:Ig-like domain-containing protein n=1 Tax=Cyprinodon variegatus TaxID=28743 RepID=A0A3Q2CRF3_CYPVA